MKRLFNFGRKKEADFGDFSEDADAPMAATESAALVAQVPEKKAGNLVFGTAWVASLSDSKEELLSLSRSENAEAYVAIESSNHPPTYGFHSGYVNKKEKLLSGGLAFYYYSEQPNKCLIHPINPASCAVVCINDGIPTIDQILQSSEAKAIISEQIESWVESKRSYELFGFFPEDGFIPPFPIKALSLDELEIFARENSTTHFQPIGKTDWKKYAVSVGLLFMIGSIAAVLYENEAGSNDEKSPQELHVERIQQKITSIRNAKGFPRQTAEVMNPFLLSIPWRLPGWEFTKASCMMKETACILNYKRLPGGTAKSLIEAFKVPLDQNNVQFISLDVATVRVEHPQPPKAEDLELLFVNDFYRSFLSWCQLLTDAKYKSNLTQPAYAISPPPGYKFPKEQLIRTGDFEFAIPRTDVQQLIRIPNYLVIEQIDVQIGSGTNMPEFSYKGKFYAY